MRRVCECARVDALCVCVCVSCVVVCACACVCVGAYATACLRNSVYRVGALIEISGVLCVGLGFVQWLGHVPRVCVLVQ